jgi:hypothetical protein
MSIVFYLVHLQDSDGNLEYDVESTSLETALIAVTERGDPLEENVSTADASVKEKHHSTAYLEPSSVLIPRNSPVFARDVEPFALPSGGAISLVAQAVVIARKRFMTLRRTYLMRVIALAMVCCVALIPIVFLMHRNQTCERIYETSAVSSAGMAVLGSRRPCSRRLASGLTRDLLILYHWEDEHGNDFYQDYRATWYSRRPGA